MKTGKNRWRQHSVASFAHWKVRRCCQRQCLHYLVEDFRISQQHGTPPFFACSDFRGPQELAELDRSQRRKRLWRLVGAGALEFQHRMWRRLASVGADVAVEGQAVAVCRARGSYDDRLAGLTAAVEQQLAFFGEEDVGLPVINRETPGAKNRTGVEGHGQQLPRVHGG
jgi:hypothetical protein